MYNFRTHFHELQRWHESSTSIFIDWNIQLCQSWCFWSNRQIICNGVDLQVIKDEGNEGVFHSFLCSSCTDSSRTTYSSLYIQNLYYLQWWEYLIHVRRFKLCITIEGLIFNGLGWYFHFTPTFHRSSWSALPRLHEPLWYSVWLKVCTIPWRLSSNYSSYTQWLKIKNCNSLPQVISNLPSLQVFKLTESLSLEDLRENRN